MTSKVLSIYYSFVMVLCGESQHNKCLSFLPFPFPTIKIEQTNKNKQKKKLGHIIIFLVMTLVSVLPRFTLCKGESCRAFTKNNQRHHERGISPLPTTSFAFFRGVKSYKDLVHL